MTCLSCPNRGNWFACNGCRDLPEAITAALAAADARADAADRFAAECKRSHDRQVEIAEQCAEEGENARSAALSRAVTLCEEISELRWGEWKKHADMIDQGRSLGADECAEAMRRAMKETP